MTHERVWSLPFGLCFDVTEAKRHPEAFERVLVDLYAGLRASLVGYVSHLVGRSADAEDVVQVTFLRLFDALQQGTQIENARSWIYRVAHNLALDAARKDVHEKTLAAAWLAERGTLTAKTAEDTVIQRESLAHGLTVLNDRERQCLLLRADGLRYHEIAEVVGISPKAVSVYLVRALKKFAKEYGA